MSTTPDPTSTPGPAVPDPARPASDPDRTGDPGQPTTPGPAPDEPSDPNVDPDTRPDLRSGLRSDTAG